MNILRKYHDILVNNLKEIYGESLNPNISLEFPKDPSMGDISTNAVMILTKELSLEKDKIIKDVSDIFYKTGDFKTINVVGSGFINLIFKDNILQDLILKILNKKEIFGHSDLGKGKKINIEYVSANPTGPLHVGHTRGAVFGDVLSNIMEFVGFKVCREYYINDSGEQVNKLAHSTYIRYLQALGEETKEIEDGFYPGEYLIELGKTLKDQHNDKFVNSPEEEWIDIFRESSIEHIMNLIKEDLNSLGVHHDVFTSEKYLLDSNIVSSVYEELDRKELLYEGISTSPKGNNNEEWTERKHILFKSKKFGDDEDRVVKKHDGSWTYFMPDIAYHKNKFDRGFSQMINILGADHSGYISRMKSAIKAITQDKAIFDIKTCQLVKLTRGGQPVKMSKRSGNFITLKEIIEEVGSDAIRFMMVSRKGEAKLDFDFELFKKENNDNPVFYVQYAHARICSLLKNASNSLKIDIDDNLLANSNLSLLNNKIELDIIKLIASYPKIVEQAASHKEPHRVPFYLRDLSSAFHQYWNLKINDERVKIVDENDIESTLSRLTLLRVVAITISSALSILGIKALNELR
ncbi:MAG: arginine--tRNA ligase [Rhodobiaceae bacterium]|nr:arginine--tRNA ligase [Rhodobiaceae bacterium]